MKSHPTSLILLAAALALGATARSAERTVAELEKELALAKAKIAVLEAEADLAAKKATLTTLQGNKADAPKPSKPVGAKDDKTSGGPERVKKPSSDVTTETEDLRKKFLPSSFEWREVRKTGTDLLTHAGTRVIAPYAIDKDTRELKTDATRLGGYLEVVYSNTWAWQPDGAASSIAWGARGAQGKPCEKSQWQNSWKDKKLLSDSDAVWVSPHRWFCDPDDTTDYTARVSLEFGKGAERTASTITGSGDFNGEIAFNGHFLQGYATNTLFTLGLGGSAGASTDREARRVHPRYFAGLVGKLGRVIDVDGKGKKRLALAHLGLGYAQVDTVRFDPGDATKTHVIFDGPVPRYRRSRGPAMELELLYPIADANYAYLGGRVYDRTDPGQWSLTLGYSFNFVEFLGSFQSKSNPAEPAAAKDTPAKK